LSVRAVVVSAGVIWRGDRVLLTRRREGDSLAGFWEFPGGKVEDGEDPRVTAVRECQEECGIEIRVRDILDVTFYRYPTKDILLLFYEADWVSGEVQNLEVAAHAWVMPSELPGYTLPPPDEAVLQKIRSGVRLDTPERPR
jgi:8-oxo-dGTP diphosphatase